MSECVSDGTIGPKVLVGITTLQCNGMSRQKRITIKNPATINQDICTYHIQAYSTNVCQLLVEFQIFELQPPIYEASRQTLECMDHLTIGEFTLCGANSGQHLYLPFNVAKGIKEMTLAFSLSQRWSQSKWSLVVTQLECATSKKRMPLLAPSSPPSNAGNGIMNWLNMRTIFNGMPIINGNNNDLDLLAPAGCNQYFTQPSGTIKSFNFHENGSSYYLPNMNYVMCIKSIPGATMIEYQTSKFSMSNEVPILGGYDNDCHSTVQTEGRREDYLMIPQSFVSSGLHLQPTYYCGNSLQNTPALVASAPFILYFSSDGITDETETGFSINYRIRTTTI
ncbi:uncharacterized protein LOC142240148 [Haematobia irritans]|uniref:uncharacterized protein LOC142240148 n=1 Tax=Haematobia irritans TaxID=7368 RepID=UPI003F4FF6E3